jgi:O-antigen ligase
VTEALIGLLAAAWAMQHAVRLRSRVRWPALSAPLVAFLLVAACSLLAAPSLTLALKELVKWVEVLVVVVIVHNEATPKRSQRIVFCLLLAAAAQALLGVYQFVTASGPQGFALLGRYVRAFGTFEQPNPFAGYLGAAAPLPLALALGWLRGRGKAYAASEWTIGWLALGALPLLAAGIGMSWSRGGWLAFAAATLVVCALQSRAWALATGGALALVLLATALGLVPDAILGRLTSFVPFVGVADISGIEVTDANYASLERLAHWQSALHMWRDHPWFGVGFGNYSAVYAEYALPKWPYALGHAHNYYLNIAAETGLIGLSAYLGLWATAAWQTWRAARGTTSAYHRALALGALGMLVHVSVHNVVDNLWVHNIYIHVAIVLGLVQHSGHLAAEADLSSSATVLPQPGSGPSPKGVLTS